MSLSQTAYPSAPQEGQGVGRVPQRHQPQDEGPLWTELEAGVLPADRIELSPAEDLHARINVAYGHDALPLNWHNDAQYGYPPPGAPNEQAFESGHTQITVLNQSAEQGWGTDPAFAWPRYPHMENHARAYSWGLARRFGEMKAPKEFRAIQQGMQQRRDLLLRDILAHRVHGAIFGDAATVPWTYTTRQVSPYYQPAPIGHEGVLPD